MGALHAPFKPEGPFIARGGAYAIRPCSLRIKASS